MGLSDELGRLKDEQVTAISAPKGWQPGVEYDESGGEGRTAPRPAGDRPIGHDEILEEFGLDPDAWEVVTLRRSKWQQSKRLENGDRDVLWLEAYKATFRALPAGSPKAVAADFEQLAQRVGSWSRPKGATRKAGSGPRATYLIALSDWQLGKGESGGTPRTVERILSSLDRAATQLLTLRSIGYSIDEVAFLGLGDITEGCSGFYSMQEFQADLDVRAQQSLAWDLTAKHIDTFTNIADRVVVSGVSGNHGEPRRDGKAFTTFEDNFDLLLLDVMKRLQEREPGWSNVEVVIPEDPLSTCLELSGAKVGAVHGHQFGKGTGAAEKGRVWWQGQALGGGPVSDAEILCCGHLHHHVVNELAMGRTLIQAPSQDGGSYWFKSITGQSAPTGLMTMLVGSELGVRKFDHLRIV